MPADRLLHPRAGQSAKVGSLSDFEYRVWTQYLLSSDDFGVMRASGAKLQADNFVLERRPKRVVQAALERLITVGLLHTFEHQGERYVFQHNWQRFQGVEYPRATLEPKPPAEALRKCDDATRALFEKHPGGAGKRRGQPSSGSGGSGGTFSEGSPNVPQTFPEGSPSTARACPRETANGLRQTANGERQTADQLGEPLPPLDEWLAQLTALYPRDGVTSGHLTELAFMDVFKADPRPPREVFDEMLANLENQRNGYQWSVKRMIPNLENWLRFGKWKQLHQAAPPLALVSERTLHTEIAADAFVKGGGRHGSH